MEEPDFILDYDTKAPAPLDPHVANVWLRTRSNRFVDGYELEISASFGEELIPLEGDDFSVSVLFSLKKVSIDLQFKHCQPVPIFDAGEAYKKEEVTRKSNRRGVGLNADVDASTETPTPSASGKGSIQAEYRHESTSTETLTRTKRWKPVGPTTIEVEDGGSKLNGPLVDGVRGWLVKPDATKDYSGVVASLTTRPEWIEFGKIDEDTSGGGVGKKLRQWMRGRKPRDKALFDLLLRTLAAKGLQTALNRDATLAMHLQVLRKPPSEDALTVERPMVIPAGPAVRSIGVDSSVIDVFLSTDSSGRVELLGKMGVPDGELAAILTGNDAEQPRPERLFIAGTAPPSALKSLEFTLRYPKGICVPDWDEANQNRSRTDLVSLGLIEVKDGLVRPLVSPFTPAVAALRHAAMKAPTLQATREILLDNPDATGVDIGSQMGRQFHRNYNSKASKLRVGNALRRWAIWLEPHLVDPSAESGRTRLRVSSEYDKPGIGAPSLATPDDVQKAQAALDQGMRAEDVAKLIGVSRSGFYHWAKLGIVTLPRRNRAKGDS